MKEPVHIFQNFFLLVERLLALKQPALTSSEPREVPTVPTLERLPEPLWSAAPSIIFQDTSSALHGTPYCVSGIVSSLLGFQWLQLTLRVTYSDIGLVKVI